MAKFKTANKHGSSQLNRDDSKQPANGNWCQTTHITQSTKQAANRPQDTPTVPGTGIRYDSLPAGTDTGSRASTEGAFTGVAGRGVHWALGREKQVKL